MARHERPACRPRAHRWSDVVRGALAVLFMVGAVLVYAEHVRFEPVLSGSMQPGIRPGDLAVLRPVPATSLRLGEVIAYLPPNEETPVVHRIVSVDSSGLVTRGDANSVDDPWGRVEPTTPAVDHLVAVIPKVGWLLRVRNWLFVLLGTALLVVASIAVARPQPRAPDDEDRPKANRIPREPQRVRREPEMGQLAVPLKER